MTPPMTITEKILARHARMDFVSPGDLIEVDIDLALANDVTAPMAIRVFDELGTGKVFDREKGLVLESRKINMINCLSF